MGGPATAIFKCAHTAYILWRTRVMFFSSLRCPPACGLFAVACCRPTWPAFVCVLPRTSTGNAASAASANRRQQSVVVFSTLGRRRNVPTVNSFFQNRPDRLCCHLRVMCKRSPIDSALFIPTCTLASWLRFSNGTGTGGMDAWPVAIRVYVQSKRFSIDSFSVTAHIGA